MAGVQNHSLVVLELPEIEYCVITLRGGAIALSMTPDGREHFWQLSQLTLMAELTAKCISFPRRKYEILPVVIAVGAVNPSKTVAHEICRQAAIGAEIKKGLKPTG